MARLAAAAVSILVSSACAYAEDPQQFSGTIGRGLICDTRQQVVRFLEVVNQGRQTTDALGVVNDEARNPIACGIVTAVFADGKPSGKSLMHGQSVSIFEVTVVAFGDGSAWTTLSPRTQYVIRTDPAIEL